jgi:hypothetical protein
MPLFLNFKPNTMMNENARQLLSNLLDANWQIERNKDDKELTKILEIAYTSIKTQLIEEMGAAEYMKFMKIGKEMFSPSAPIFNLK